MNIAAGFFFGLGLLFAFGFVLALLGVALVLFYYWLERSHVRLVKRKQAAVPRR